MGRAEDVADLDVEGLQGYNAYECSLRVLSNHFVKTMRWAKALSFILLVPLHLPVECVGDRNCVFLLFSAH